MKNTDFQWSPVKQAYIHAYTHTYIQHQRVYNTKNNTQNIKNTINKIYHDTNLDKVVAAVTADGKPFHITAPL